VVGLSLAWAILRSRCLCHSAEEICSWSCSGWSAVLGIDTVGGSPDGDFTKEGGCRVAAWWCPYGLFPAMAGAVSNLICDAGYEL
jgi:hypothetical protein